MYIALLLAPLALTAPPPGNSPNGSNAPGPNANAPGPNANAPGPNANAPGPNANASGPNANASGPKPNAPNANGSDASKPPTGGDDAKKDGGAGASGSTPCSPCSPKSVDRDCDGNIPPKLSKEQIQAIFDSWTKTGGYGSSQKVPDELYQAYVSKVVPIMCLREQAQFLATLVYQSNGLQKQPSKECKEGIADKCPEGKFYGRGLMNLSYDFNYQAASKAIYNGKDDLVKNPDLASTPEGSWATALWFWMANIRQKVVDNNALKCNEFGIAVDAVNGPNECKGGPSKEALQRLKIYNEVLQITKLGGTGKLDFCQRPADPADAAKAAEGAKDADAAPAPAPK